MLRRQLVWGSIALFSLSMSRPLQGQEVCKEDGPSGDEILKDLLDAAGKKPKYNTFNIEIRREQVAKFRGKDKTGKDREEDGVTGIISLNGRQIGHTVENDKLKIPAGQYPGYVRYISGKTIVQGPFGSMASAGDFLLEVGKVPGGRTHILLHGGTKPWHSEGCILLGAVKSENDADGKIKKSVSEGSALATLRKEFYGTETPVACPNTSIIIKII